MRGTLPPQPDADAEVGLIPAGAGNTQAATAGVDPRAAHPRRCGEHGDHRGEGAGDLGSSPQVRGTLLQGGGRLGDVGLIPAGAGNTPSRGATRSPRWAHPRRCGEHPCPAKPRPATDGSSPQVRGTLGAEVDPGHVAGLIPAGAGNTASPSPYSWSPWAHPRRCGEHWMPASASHASMGSSPQVRGTRIRGRAARDGAGLIPAGAGNTASCATACVMVRAHPRRCGEHSYQTLPRMMCQGSSPQVRGTPSGRRRRRRSGGLIPAGAGNTGWSSRPATPRWAHPRRCGEHRGVGRFDRTGRGSSPQVRGTPQVVGLGEGDLGLIPAGAGNTSRRRGPSLT